MDSSEIGAKLVKLRGDKSQREVANAIGISTSALSSYECGDRVPRDKIKVKIAKYYKKSIQFIFFSN